MTTSEKLMDASDRLAKLSKRAKQAEDRTATARSQAKAEVEQSADKARLSAQAQADGLRDSANATEAHVSASWNDLQKSWATHLAKVRQDMEARKAEHDTRRAESRAEHTERDALFAIDYAYATIEEAEYTVLDAISARMEADELAAATR
jgi:hypothetical protein